MPVPAPTDRYHALDSLRGFAMLLGVVLHGAVSFMANPPGFWPVRDNDPTRLADMFLVAVHDFRMQLFFLLAGFFGCLLYQKYGLAGMTKHRLKRIAVPFVLALMFIVPTVQAVAVYCEVENVRVGGVRGEVSPLRPLAAKLIEANPEVSTLQLVADFFVSGDSLTHLPLIHLWFLYYLLIYVGAVAVLSPLLSPLTGTRLLARIDGAFRHLIESRWRVLVLALLTFPLMLPMKWVVDTPSRWSLQWHVAGYYFAFFAFGWMLFRHRALVPTFGRGWKFNLVFANLTVLPMMVGLIATGMKESKDGADAFAWQLGGFAASVLYTWLMITGLWGAFLRLFANEVVWVRYLADSSYWCYLASITPLVVFQYIVKDWQLPWPVKFALVTVATMVVLLASYEWCVRYTVLGAILNGRKHRTSGEMGESTIPRVASVVEEPARV